jgi:hypothetical protein
MGMMNNVFLFMILFFGIELYAKCSVVPESIKNKYASDMFGAFITQSQGKSTAAFLQFDLTREQAKKAGENILNLIAIERLFVWYRMYGTSLRLFHQNPTGNDWIRGGIQDLFTVALMRKLSIGMGCVEKF